MMYQTDVSSTAQSNLEAAKYCDVLIIGAGLAGLSTALSLPSDLQIIVLSKKALDICSSHDAQGGIAASLSFEDSVTDHVQDTLTAGAGLCDRRNTTSILTAGASAIAWLESQGVKFTREDDTDLTSCLPSNTCGQSSKSGTAKRCLPPLHLTQEGGHSRRRIAHIDDATGRHIMTQLTQQALQANNIELLTGVEALELITKSSSDPDHPTHYQGALVVNSATQQLSTIHSQAAVLASGGLGQLFQRATAPEVCLGDGVMMAWQAGCRLANLEFVQFHPTGLALDESNFLISEAVRGEGGYLRCPITGQRFMHHYDPRLELAPRDIVARAIADQITKNKLGYVHLDISHKPAEFIQQHFPQITATLRKFGIDMSQEPIPVAPTAHYTCGGVVTTADGLTDVIGLYAAGEVAYTGLHGANRLASNSLLECVVTGRQIARHLPQYLTAACSYWSKPQLNNFNIVPISPCVIPTTAGADADNDHPKLKPLPESAAKRLSALKMLMTQHLGITRHERGILAALQQLKYWQSKSAQLGCQEGQKIIAPTSNCNTRATNPSAAALKPQLESWRWQRLLTLAIIMLQAAQNRKESRGGHFRSDWPVKSSAAKISIIAPDPSYPRRLI